jgi:hypothetical protein
MSVDLARSTLSEAKTFLAWAVTKRWARTDALARLPRAGGGLRGGDVQLAPACFEELG